MKQSIISKFKLAPLYLSMKIRKGYINFSYFTFLYAVTNELQPKNFYRYLILNINYTDKRNVYVSSSQFLLTITATRTINLNK